MGLRCTVRGLFIVEDLVPVVCVHIRGVSPIKGAGLEGCPHAIKGAGLEGCLQFRGLD